MNQSNAEAYQRADANANGAVGPSMASESSVRERDKVESDRVEACESWMTWALPCRKQSGKSMGHAKQGNGKDTNDSSDSECTL